MQADRNILWGRKNLVPVVNVPKPRDVARKLVTRVFPTHKKMRESVRQRGWMRPSRPQFRAVGSVPHVGNRKNCP